MSETKTQVKELPMLFSGEMVRAILSGAKSQTRRVLKPQPIATMGGECLEWRPTWAKLSGRPNVDKACGKLPCCAWNASKPVMQTGAAGIVQYCPYGKPGDRLYVRETWAPMSDFDPELGAIYRADMHMDQAEVAWNWKPSIHMPRKFSRITLEITDVRVERLCEISEDDARAEGVERNLPQPASDWVGDEHGWIPYCSHHPKACECFPAFSAVESFKGLWQSINGADSWAASPFVWVISFRKVTP